ncbi:MAG: hypothetical protein GTO17_08275 [Candidatus Aminicenantes bacterium]|nr:hypothetical protein [Candidatus Aminicenantes bacterium]
MPKKKRKRAWSMKEVNRVIPTHYPSGRMISPEARRQMYEFYLLEKKHRRLKKVM